METVYWLQECGMQKVKVSQECAQPGQFYNPHELLQLQATDFDFGKGLQSHQIRKDA